jgi:multiple sugar transport system substrate-binding protein
MRWLVASTCRDGIGVKIHGGPAADVLDIASLGKPCMSEKIPLTGLTWDHPRAYEGLLVETAAFNQSQQRVHLSWKRQSLRGFEDTPITRNAANHDLIILDHPFMGDAAGTGRLLPLGDRATVQQLTQGNPFIGPSLDNYFYKDSLWALPMDAACQTAACRPGRLPEHGLPRTLEEVWGLAEARGLTLSMACPHACMNFLTICGLLGLRSVGRTSG